MASDVTYSSTVTMLEAPDTEPVLTFRSDGTIGLGAKYSWSDAAQLLIQAYGNGVTARIAALEAELAEAKAERDEMDALYHEGGTWEQQLSAAEARATAAEARAEKMADALKKTRATFEVEYHKDGRVASVGHASDGLRKLVALLDAALGRPE